MPGNCSMENTSSPATAEPRTEGIELSTGIGYFLLCLRRPFWHKDTLERLSTGEPSMVFHTLAHGSPHRQHCSSFTAPSAICVISGRSKLRWRVTGLTYFWSHHLQHSAVQVTKSLLATALSPLVLHYRCFWPIPVTCIISLIQGRRQTCTHPAEDNSQLWWARFHLRNLHADSKISILRKMWLST